MFYFVLETIAVSILVSLFGTWIKLIPRYPNWKYSLIQQVVNVGILTIVLTLLFFFEVYPSWLLLFAMMLLILWSSVRFTNRIAKTAGRSTAPRSTAGGVLADQ